LEELETWLVKKTSFNSSEKVTRLQYNHGLVRPLGGPMTRVHRGKGGAHWVRWMSHQMVAQWQSSDYELEQA
jgi:hypothetical protein